MKQAYIGWLIQYIFKKAHLVYFAQIDLIFLCFNQEDFYEATPYTVLGHSWQNVQACKMKYLQICKFRRIKSWGIKIQLKCRNQSSVRKDKRKIKVPEPLGKKTTGLPTFYSPLLWFNSLTSSVSWENNSRVRSSIVNVICLKCLFYQCYFLDVQLSVGVNLQNNIN